MEELATVADLERQVGREFLVQTADRDGDGEADAEVLAEAVAHANGEVARATLRCPPINVEPERLAAMLRQQVCTIAARRLALLAGRDDRETRRAYRGACRWLARAIAGTLPEQRAIADKALAGDEEQLAGLALGTAYEMEPALPDDDEE